MSGTFEKREKGFEAKFAHDEELAFKAKARRAKLAGQWAANLMGLAGDESAAYVKEAIGAEIEGGQEALLAKIKGDLDGKGIERSDHQVSRELEEHLTAAKEQILNEGEGKE
jgi:hypothetical protein